MPEVRYCQARSCPIFLLFKRCCLASAIERATQWSKQSPHHHPGSNRLQLCAELRIDASDGGAYSHAQFVAEYGPRAEAAWSSSVVAQHVLKPS